MRALGIATLVEESAVSSTDVHLSNASIRSGTPRAPGSARKIIPEPDGSSCPSCPMDAPARTSSKGPFTELLSDPPVKTPQLQHIKAQIDGRHRLREGHAEIDRDVVPARSCELPQRRPRQ
jgi:hypothetical protein